MSQQLDLLTENFSQWSILYNVMPTVQKKEIKPFVLLALKELEGKPDSRMSSLMNADKFAAVRAVVRHTVRLRSAIKENWKPEEIRNFLESLKFSSECTTELTLLLCSEQIYQNIPSHLRIKPGVVSVEWKIDLSLCQANIESESANGERAKEIMHRDINIIVILHLTNGQKKTYCMSVSKFHELRFAIASALKSVIVLERRKCMRKD